MVTLEDYIRAEHELDVRESKLGWRIHATIYAIVNAVLILINLLVISFTDDNFVWFPFPLVCWGIGLTVHYLMAVRGADRLVEAHQSKVRMLAERRSTS